MTPVYLHLPLPVWVSSCHQCCCHHRDNLSLVSFLWNSQFCAKKLRSISLVQLLEWKVQVLQWQSQSLAESVTGRVNHWQSQSLAESVTGRVNHWQSKSLGESVTLRVSHGESQSLGEPVTGRVSQSLEKSVSHWDSQSLVLFIAWYPVSLQMSFFSCALQTCAQF